MIISFVCAECERRFTSERSITELVEEFRLVNPEVSMEECVEIATEAARGEGLVCDACYGGLGVTHATVH